MAIQKIIAQHVKRIDVRFYKSRGYGYEGQEFVAVTINGAKYTNSCCQNDGVTESIVEWLNDEVRDNEKAQKVLEHVKTNNESYTGANCIQKNEDGTYSIKNFGESPVFQVLRQLGVELSTLKSSERRNAYLVGYAVRNKGVEIEDEAVAA